MDILKSIQSVLGIYTPVDTTRVFGCDTSHWSNVLDWNMAKLSGMSFTVGKAMDGITGPTKYFIDNYNGAKKVGILTGCYSWLYKNTVLSTKQQAIAYANLYKQFPTDLPPTIDFEWTSSGNPTASVDLYDFLIRFEELTGRKCMVYSAYGYWREFGSTSSFYAKYPLWTAQYGISKPTSYAPWNENYSIFQFTDRAQGSLFGYPTSGESMADMNYFNGSKEDLYKFCGLEVPGGTTPPIDPPIIVDPPIDPPLTNTFTITASPSLNIRSLPSTTANKVGNIIKGLDVTILEFKRIGDDVWGRILHNGVGGWIAMLLGGQYYTSKVDFSDVPVVVEPPVIVPPVGIPEFKPSNLYTFSKESLWFRPSSGPLVTPTFNITKTSSTKELLLNAIWVNWMRDKLSNTAQAFSKIIQPAWGSSKGYNSKGLLIFNTLVYPGRNVVEIEENSIQTGIDGQFWGRVKCIDMKLGIPSDKNYIDTPQLVQTVYGSNSKWSWFSLGVNAPKVPILKNDTEKFIEMKWLVSVDAQLPKTVKITASPSLNIRDLPNSNIIDKYLFGESVIVYNVLIATGGIWAETDKGYIALRFNDSNLTDWII